MEDPDEETSEIDYNVHSDSNDEEHPENYGKYKFDSDEVRYY